MPILDAREGPSPSSDHLALDTIKPPPHSAVAKLSPAETLGTLPQVQGIRRKQRAERDVRQTLEYLYILLITNKQNKINETYGSSLSGEGFGSVERTAEGTEGTMVIQ